MRVLFDQSTPWPLHKFLTDHAVSTTWEQGWSRLTNGELLDAAEAVGFEVLATTGKNLRYQQNLKNRRVAVVVITQQQWPALRPHADKVLAAVNAATPGSYAEIKIPSA